MIYLGILLIGMLLGFGIGYLVRYLIENRETHCPNSCAEKY